MKPEFFEWINGRTSGRFFVKWVSPWSDLPFLLMVMHQGDKCIEYRIDPIQLESRLGWRYEVARAIRLMRRKMRVGAA